MIAVKIKKESSDFIELIEDFETNYGVIGFFSSTEGKQGHFLLPNKDWICLLSQTILHLALIYKIPPLSQGALRTHVIFYI